MITKAARRGAVALTALVISLAFVTINPTTVDAGTADPPTGTCQPGDGPIPHPGLPEFFEYRCICHDIILNGQVIGTICHWELVSKSGGARSTGWAYSNSTYGCLLSINVLTSEASGGATNAGIGQVIGEAYPCNYGNPKSQPAGEYRDQAVLEYYGGGAWHPCTATGYRYNQISGFGVTDWANMGTVPDCGTATYRLSNTVAIYEGGAWRGGTRWAPSLPMN